MKFNKGDLIDDKYLVLDSMTMDGKEYVCVHFDDDQNTFLEVVSENNETYIQNIEDDNEFEKVMNKFSSRAKVILDELVKE